MDLEKIYNENLQERGAEQLKMWKYYRDDPSVIPIYSRKPIGPLNEDTLIKTHVNFFKDIIDLKQGYMSEQIKITSNENSELIKQFNNDSNMKTINSQTCEYSSVEGLSHRLVYTKEGIFKQKNIHGWQVVYEGSDIYDPDKAYYYYTLKEKENNLEPGNYCNVYDRTNVIYFKKEVVKKGRKEEVTWNQIGLPQQHNFKSVPITPFQNTSNNDSNFKYAVKVNDDYDVVISDAVGEIESTRGSYLIINGNLQTIRNSDGSEMPVARYIKQTNSFMIPSNVDGKPAGDVKFLEKNINDTAIQNSLNRLRTHIYELSGSVDLKELTSAERVFSIKASLMRLENNAITTENYMRLGLRRVLSLWIEWIREYNGVTVDLNSIEIEFSRKFPVDSEAQAELFTKLAAILDIADALKLAGYENYEEIAERSNSIPGV